MCMTSRTWPSRSGSARLWPYIGPPPSPDATVTRPSGTRQRVRASLVLALGGQAVDVPVLTIGRGDRAVLRCTTVTISDTLVSCRLLARAIR